MNLVINFFDKLGVKRFNTNSPDLFELFIREVVVLFELIKELNSILANESDVLIGLIKPASDLLKVLAIVEELVCIRIVF